MILALFLLTFICATASADTANGTETQITTNEFGQRLPAIHGDKIVWSDEVPAIDEIYTSDIYVYDLSTSEETRVTTNNKIQELPAIYGDKIVWQDWRNGNLDIYMYDLSTSQETQITTDESAQEDPAIYEDRIVWTDFRNGNYDIYMYDLSTSAETRITTNESNQLNPAIYGNKIVWQDARDGGTDLYMYDFSTSTETWLISMSMPKPAGSYAFSDNRIVWEDYLNGNYDICMYDISTSRETQITTNESNQLWPDIYGDVIVWMDNRNENLDIYMFTLFPAAELTPLDRTNDLKDYVANLTVNSGIKKAFIAPLDASIHFLETGKDAKAVSKLKSFINLVENMKKCNRILPVDADYMITEARRIIDQIKAQ
jgi:beta propeller repeat protein